MTLDLAAISSALQANKGIDRLSALLLKEYNLLLKVGVEVEFYLPLGYNVEALSAKTSLHFKLEKGLNQYEFDLPPTTKLLALINQLNELYQLLIAETKEQIIFAPKPYPQEYGNSLHFHLNLINADTAANFFDHLNYLENAARGLCNSMSETMLVFAPTAESYARFNQGFMAPTHICFGGNNRSTAVRIPDSRPRRLEHRLAHPLIDLYLGLFILQKSIYLSLKNIYPSTLHPKIYGNAFDDQYNLPRLPSNIVEATASFNRDFFTI